jgi:hypothetical protein
MVHFIDINVNVYNNTNICRTMLGIVPKNYPSILINNVIFANLRDMQKYCRENKINVKEYLIQTFVMHHVFL